MKFFYLILIGFAGGVSCILMLSMNKSNTINIGSPGVIGMKQDTITQNDSMFSVLSYESGRLKNIKLKLYVDLKKDRAYGIHEIDFYKNGRVVYIHLSCRDTILESGDIAYEEQTLSFDKKDRLRHFRIMDNYKIICSKD